jgi:GMP synthase (glutamine-hydrolysing)
VRVLQHVAPEGPERIAEVLRARGFEIAVTRIDLGEPIPADVVGAAGLVVMGGPMGVYEAAEFPHLAVEQRLIERALAANVPILGVCLGSQLLAATLGARVYPGPAKEIGFFDVVVATGASKDPLFGAVPERFPALHWHGDVFDLPSGATHLARSEMTENQAFRFGENAYGLLFHLEVTAAQVEGMTKAFADEVRAANGDPVALAAQAKTAVRNLEVNGSALFGAWANGVAARVPG